jgi:hypothetical protein
VIAQRICDGVASGMPLTEVLRQPGMPNINTVCRWSEPGHAAEVPEFVTMYARARATQVEVLADQILSIADDGTNDYMDRMRDGKVERVVDQEHIQRSRLRVDSRKWLLSKLSPEKYGERLELAGDVASNTTINIANMLVMPQNGKLPARNTRALPEPESE